MTAAGSVMGRWKEYFEKLMNKEKKRVQRVKGVTVVDQEVAETTKAK